jgi:hypothetical protein
MTPPIASISTLPEESPEMRRRRAIAYALGQHAIDSSFNIQRFMDEYDFRQLQGPCKGSVDVDAELDDPIR